MPAGDELFCGVCMGTRYFCRHGSWCRCRPCQECDSRSPRWSHANRGDQGATQAFEANDDPKSYQEAYALAHSGLATVLQRETRQVYEENEP